MAFLADAGRAAPSEASEEPASAPFAVSLRIEGRSISHAARLMDEIGIWLQLHLGYTEQPGGPDWRTGKMRGMHEARFFVRAEPLAEHRVELAASLLPGRGFRLHAFAESRVDGRGVPGPDLDRLWKKMEEEVAALERRSPDLALEHVHLSYVSAEQAIALLKALGYSCVEFNTRQVGFALDRLYRPLRTGNGSLPVVIKVVDPVKTSLLDPLDPHGEHGDGGESYADEGGGDFQDLSGVYLHGETSGEAVERLLVVYERGDLSALDGLLEVIRSQIDRPAPQVLLQTTVLEIRSDAERDLGLTWSWASGNLAASADAAVEDSTPGALPVQVLFEKGADFVSAFTARLDAFIIDGRASIVSRPSVTVLDGRQARVRLGEHLPIIKATLLEGGGVAQDVEYIPVGVTLNLRPRVVDSGDAVTMQVEIIVSTSSGDLTQNVTVAPIVNARQVQSIVRVPDQTPLVIGGLVDTRSFRQFGRVPGLSRIPLLGRLFRHRHQDRVDSELLIVITPHVIPVERRDEALIVNPGALEDPEAGGIDELFRYEHREIVEGDLRDPFEIVSQSAWAAFVAAVRERCRSWPGRCRIPAVESVREGNIPGADVLVRKSLFDIVARSGIAAAVRAEEVMLPGFDNGTTVGETSLGDVLSTLAPGQEAVHDLVVELAEPEPNAMMLQRLSTRIRERSPGSGALDSPSAWSIPLADGASSLLRTLVLQRVLELNGDLKVAHLRPGAQILFPRPADLTRSLHRVDSHTARLHAEATDWESAFADAFVRGVDEVRAALPGLSDALRSQPDASWAGPQGFFESLGSAWASPEEDWADEEDEEDE